MKALPLGVAAPLVTPALCLAAGVTAADGTWLSLLTAFLLLSLAREHRRGSQPFVYIMFTMAGFMSGASLDPRPVEAPVVPPERVWHRGRVRSADWTPGGGRAQIVDSTGHVTDLLLDFARLPAQDSRIGVFGRPRPPFGRRNPGGGVARGNVVAVESPAALFVTDGGSGVAHGLGAFRRHARDRIDSRLDPTSAGLLRALVLGDRSGLSRELREAYRERGLAHVLAISGAHVGVLAALLVGLLRALGWRHGALVVPLVLGPYAILAGGSPSVVRAAIMTSVVAVLSLRRRRLDGGNVLAFVFILTTIVSPGAVRSAGYVLSYSATAGILAFLELPRPRRASRGTGRALPPLPRVPIDAGVALGILALALAAWPGLSRGHRAVRVALAVLAVIGTPREAPRAAITLLDVADGDAIVCELPGHEPLLVDTGRERYAGAVSRALRAMNVGRVNLVVTHPDVDHDGGVRALVDAGRVDRVFVGITERDAGHRYGLDVHRLADGDTLWSAREGSIVCLHPAPADSALADNARSVTLLVDWRGTRVLLTGDLSGQGLARLTARHRAAVAETDVLKLGHHGSRDASPPGLLSLLTPSLAVVSGAKPVASEVAGALAERRVPVYATRRLGAIRVELDPGASSVFHWGGTWRRLR